ncbi:unnamed protein product [Meloidogyne enterolobii]|uniref:Uncharacterized protein n=1 Tax=Meloidogyne enterolobii TaxID=390850 RepID=A0ACB0Z353_MELEN
MDGIPVPRLRASLRFEKIKGWKVVHKSLPRIIEYGRSEGILQATASMPGIVLAAHDAAHHQASKDNRNGDKVHLPTNDLTCWF